MKTSTKPAMTNPRPAKVAVVDEVRKHFQVSDASLLTEYRGLSVKDLQNLRRQLGSAGAEYKVYKNTLEQSSRRIALTYKYVGKRRLTCGERCLTVPNNFVSHLPNVITVVSIAHPTVSEIVPI